jgi:CBS domain-containing protein
VWWRTGSLARATRLASDVGKGFALALMVLGAFEIFAGALIGGLWLVFIGMFLRGMAGAGYQSLMIRQALDDVTLDQVMIRDVVSVGPDLPIRKLIDEYILAYGYRGFPVIEHGRALGLISIRDAAAVPEPDRDRVRVAERMTPAGPASRIEAKASLTEALRRMVEGDLGRLLVVRDGELVGMITKTGLLRFVEMRQVLKQA